MVFNLIYYGFTPITEPALAFAKLQLITSTIWVLLSSAFCQTEHIRGDSLIFALSRYQTGECDVKQFYLGMISKLKKSSLAVENLLLSLPLSTILPLKDTHMFSKFFIGADRFYLVTARTTLLLLGVTFTIGSLI